LRELVDLLVAQKSAIRLYVLRPGGQLRREAIVIVRESEHGFR